MRLTKKLFWFLFLVLTLVVIFYARQMKPLANAAAECPAGSYSLGDGACKLEPTGCPYGDSIPIDSPKCVAPPTEVQPEAEKLMSQNIVTEKNKCE